MKIFNRILTLFRGERVSTTVDTAGCVSCRKWLAYIRMLKKDDSFTARLHFRDGVVYVAQEFIDGDDETITIRINSARKIYERSEVVSLDIVPRPGKLKADDVLVGRVSTWKKDRDFGFIVSDNSSYYFKGSFVRDSKLLMSLDAGHEHQEVKFRVIQEFLIPGKPPAVEVLSMLADNRRNSHPLPHGSSHYSVGRRAMDDGALDVAEHEFRIVVANSSDENYFSAIKDLAETLNRSMRPNEAFDLIEEHRREFPDEEQSALDRMEIPYLHRSGRHDEEVALIDKLLSRSNITPGQKRHYIGQLKRAQACLDRHELERKRDKLVGYIKDGGVAVATCDKIDKFIDELLAADEGDMPEQGTYRRGLHRLVEWARECKKANEYSRRRECIVSMQDYLSAFAEKAIQVERPDWVLANIIYPLMDALLNAVMSDLSKVDSVDVVPLVTHSEGEQYALVDGRVILRLDISIPQTDVPSIHAVTVKAENRGNDSLDVFVADELKGGESKIVEMAIVPTSKELMSGSGKVMLRLDYERVFVDGQHESRSFKCPGLQFVLRETGFSPIGNPFEGYATGETPIGKPFFVGQDGLVNKIVSAFKEHNGGICYILHGTRRSGKTTILQNCMSQLPESEFYCIYTTLLEITSSPQPFLSRWFECLKVEVFRKDDFGEECFNDEGFNEISKDNVAAQMKYLAGWLQKRGRKLVVAIDELTRLYEYAQESESAHEEVREILRVFKSLLESKAVHFLMVGRGSMRQFHAEYSNEFHVMGIESIPLLSIDAVSELATVPILDERGESRFSDESLAQIYRYTRGLPQLTQKFCCYLVNHLNARKGTRVTLDDVEATVRLMCEGGVGVEFGVKPLVGPDFEPFFNFYMKIRDDRNILKAFDERHLVDVYYKLASYDKDSDGWMPVSQFFADENSRIALDKMCELNFVEKANGLVRMVPKLFAEWLRANPGHKREEFSE